ncbi:hypothetical protein ASD64_06235 [Mesorhizobium sp. Root157]|uniref:tetratricopeptide repeat protein n=1 Tax=Mesorhizobium sp. Root157 TaxID=1736477 RepID=UPI0006F9DA70|nr:hypothetical protein [Mesorhizobium sp. Root157]KQZ87048.1 hypothetical protein ASD64_06235 [Mesorhizobium sp. Root157]
MQHHPPAAPAVRETLKRLLVSETFSRSERARDLLQYLVEREQAGEADRLKGFSIAVDVFGKDAEFDPSTDAVVRVQAGRLRDLLKQYFATEGASEPIRITIPRGSYVPAYEEMGATKAGWRNAQGRAGGTGALPFPSLAWQMAFMWLAIGIVVATLGFVLLRQVDMLSTTAEATTTSFDTPATTSSIEDNDTDALPVIYISAREGTPEVAAVAASLRRGLSGFDTVDFIGRDVEEDSNSQQAALSFIFRVIPGSTAGSVTIELQNLGSGRMLLSRTLDQAEIQPQNIEDQIAGLLTTTITASGSVYSYVEQAGTQTGLTRCLLLNDDYYQDPNARTHENAYRCFEQLLALNAKSALVYSELSALHLEAVTDRYAYPADASRDKAMAMAHRAIQMAANSPYAHRAYGYMNSRLGNAEESIRWMRKAYEINPYDLTMAAAYGYGLIFAGQYQDGTPIMARAVEATSAHPPWWDFGLFLGEFMLGDMKGAVRATAALNPTTKKSHYLAARLIAADWMGDVRIKKERLNELMTDFPGFAANPRKTFEQRKYPADLTDRLVEALRAAGLGSSS